MKRNFFLITLLGGLVLSTTSSCSSVTHILNNTTSENPVTASATQIKEITISGSGSGYQPLKILAFAYQEKYPNIKINFNPSNQTSGGIQGVKDGIIDIGSVGRELKPEEQNGIEYQAYVQDLVIVATHREIEGVTNLTTEQLNGIYSGQITNWKEVGGPNSEILVLDRAEDETAKLLLRQYYFGPDLPMSPDAVVLQKEKEVVESVKSIPNTIGPMSLVKAKSGDLPVNLLSLDGIKPNSENARNSKYQMSRMIGIVWNPKLELSDAAQDFIQFVKSAEAAKILEEAGYITMTDPN